MEDVNTKRVHTKRVFALLLEHYDDATKSYATDWHDERIAREVGCSPKFVAKIRDEHFGPAEDPRVGQLRTDLAKLRTEAETEATSLRNMADELERSTKTRIDALGQRLAALARPQ